MSLGGGIVLEMDANEARLWNALKRAVSAEAELKNELNGVAKASKNAAKEHRVLEREAVKVKRTLETSGDKYQKRLALLGKLLDKNKISQSEFNKAINQEHEAYQKSTPAYQKKMRLIEEGARKRRALFEEGRQIEKSTMTAAEKYSARIKRLNTLLSEGVLTKKAYARASAQAWDQMKVGSREVDKVGNSMQNAFGSKMLTGVRSLASAVGIGGGLTSVVMFLRNQINDTIETASKAKELMVASADPQRKALYNLRGNDAESKAYLASVSSIVADEKVSKDFVHEVASEPLSKRGSLGPEIVMEHVREAIQTMPTDVSVASALAGAGTAISKHTGWDAVNAQGLVHNVASKAEIAQADKLAPSLAPTILAGKLAGFSPQETGSLFAAVTQYTGDDTGRKTKSAIVNLFKNADTVWEDVTKEAKYRGPTPKTTKGKVEALMSNPELAMAYVQKASLESVARPAMQTLATKGGLGDLYHQYLASMPTDPGKFGEDLNAWQTQTDKLIEQRVASSENAAKATTAAMSGIDQQRGSFASYYEQLGDQLAFADVPWYQRWGKYAYVRAESMSGNQAGLTAIEEVIEEERNKQIRRANGEEFGMFDFSDVTPREKAMSVQAAVEMTNLLNKVRSDRGDLSPEAMKVEESMEREATRILEELLAETKAMREDLNLSPAILHSDHD